MTQDVELEKEQAVPTAAVRYERAPSDVVIYVAYGKQLSSITRGDVKDDLWFLCVGATDWKWQPQNDEGVATGNGGVGWVIFI